MIAKENDDLSHLIDDVFVFIRSKINTGSTEKDVQNLIVALFCSSHEIACKFFQSREVAYAAILTLLESCDKVEKEIGDAILWQ